MNPMRNNTVLGVVFLALLLSGVWASYGVFTQKFTDYDTGRRSRPATSACSCRSGPT